MGIKIFCDFDGTVSLQDIGDSLFRGFAGNEVSTIDKEWMQDKITAQECWARLFRAAPSITRPQLEDHTDLQKIDPHFKQFVEFCSARKVEFYVLSDGFDFYIERFLKNHGLETVKFFANHLDFDGVGTAYPTFPFTDSECDKCGNCKRNHLLSLTGEDDVIVYIGDGYSDRCPAEHADVVFAKRDLLRYCQARNVSFYAFQTFRDVTERLAAMIVQTGIRRRRRAELKRREAFMAG
jgi:2,3-diketo-5-methylthio-1-phosphopentane phosphatase